MFTAATRRKIARKLRMPVRPHCLSEMAEDLMAGTRYQSVPNFLQALEDEGLLQQHRLKARNGRELSLCGAFPLEDLTPYELAVALFPGGYFCNLTAIYHHGLTNQIPKAVYFCHETITSRKRRHTDLPSESRIRSAFVKPSRHTSYVVEFKGHGIVILDREKGTDYGVREIHQTRSPCPSGSRISSLERALIDAVVAPQYNGGASSLLSYYAAARTKLSIARLIELYGQCDFIYPYAQAIGFLLDHAGLHAEADELRVTYPPRVKFYIDHSAKSTWKYDERWMLYYPEGLASDN